MAGDPNSAPIAEYPANNHIPCDYALPVAPELGYGQFIASGVLLPAELYRDRRRRILPNAALDKAQAPTSPPAHSFRSSPAKTQSWLGFLPV